MIKILINKTGSLSLLRGKEMKRQVCPHDGRVDCGDLCPLFKEPAKKMWSAHTKKYKGIGIELCSGEIKCNFSEFKDLR